MRIVLGLLVGFLCLGAHSYGETPLYKAQEKNENISDIILEFEKKIIELAEKKGIPGFALGIVSGGKTTYTKCYGVRSLTTKEPITPSTVFQLGSLSKTIAGTFMGILHHKKMLTLNDTVSKHLPNFSYAPGILTLKHVLTHTTGIPRFGFNALIEAETMDQTGLLGRLQKTEGKCVPGACYDYHNVAYSISAPIVEAVTGQNYEDALRTYVFTPLHMDTASASFKGIMSQENRALPHQKTKNGYVTCKTYRKGYYEVAPAGGINASLKDMCAFLTAHMGHNPEVIPHELLQTLHTPYTPAKDIFERNPANIKRFKGSFYGIGWRILDYEGEKILFHAGWVKGFINIVAFIPRKNVGIVVLQNAETSFPWIAAMTFIDAILNVKGHAWDTKPIAYKQPNKVKTKGKIATSKPKTQKKAKEAKPKTLKAKAMGGKKVKQKAKLT